MTDDHQVTIVGNDDPGWTASLLVDGHDISSTVTSLRLDIDALRQHTLTLQLRAFPLNAHLEGVKVRVDDETAEVLRWIGWTPPPGNDPDPR